MTRNKNVTMLTLSAMLAALAFICFSYLRIEIPMGGGMTGKIYIGHTFILLSAFLFGAKYGGLTGAVGLSLADVLAGYVTSAPPTFIAKFILGLSASLMANQIFHLNAVTNKRTLYLLSGAAGTVACLVNVITEPVIRYVFKAYVLGYPVAIAYLASVNCAVSMAISAVPSVVLASFLYVTFRLRIVKDLPYGNGCEPGKDNHACK